MWCHVCLFPQPRYYRFRIYITTSPSFLYTESTVEKNLIAFCILHFITSSFLLHLKLTARCFIITFILIRYSFRCEMSSRTSKTTFCTRFKYPTIAPEPITIWNHGFHVFGILGFLAYVYLLNTDKEENFLSD